MKANLRDHMGVWVKLAIYLSIAFITDLLSRLGGLTIDIVNNMFWWNWAVLYGSPLLSALIVWRIFLDGSLEQSKQALKKKQEEDKLENNQEPQI